MKLMKILSLILVICCVKKVTSQNIYKDSLEITKLVKQTKNYASKKDYNQAIDLYREVIYNRKNKKDLAFDYYRLGFYFKKNRQLDSAYLAYIKSRDLYKEINDSIMVAKRLLNMAKIESNYELHNKSDSTAISALKYLNDNNPVLISSINNTLGINANEQKEYKESIKWYNTAIEKTNDSVKKIRYISNKAINYRCLNEYGKSIKLYKLILKSDYYDSINELLRAKIIDNYSYTKFLAKEKVDEKEFFIAQKKKIEIKDFKGLLANYSHLSDFYKESNRKKSLIYAYKMYNLSKNERLPNDRVEALDKIIELEKVSKIRKFAMERVRLSDSIMSSKRISSNKLVTVIYNFDNEKKERLFAEKKVIENKLLIKEQEEEKFIWIFIGSGILLSSILYFFYRRKREEKNKIIEVYKTETRLAKKIHDELANDVYLAMNKIQKENREDTSVLCDLEKIYSLTRNISHENSPVVTGEQFEDFLKQLFLEFSIDTCRVMSKGLSEVQVNTLAKEKQIVMYRVLQELLVNMKKHSKANLVVISFSVLKGAIQVRYKDNGIGIDNLSLKNGLQNMETRIKSIGGTIIFESEIQKGFQAKFQLKK